MSAQIPVRVRLRSHSSRLDLFVNVTTSEHQIKNENDVGNDSFCGKCVLCIEPNEWKKAPTIA